MEDTKTDILARELTDGVAIVWKYFVDHDQPEELRTALSLLQPALELLTEKTHHEAMIDGVVVRFGPGKYSEESEAEQ